MMLGGTTPQQMNGARWNLFARLSPETRIGVALAAVLLFALAVRGQRSTFGLPYLQHWDEPHIGHAALSILQSGDFNPHFFHYGSLPIYLNATVDVLGYYHLVGQPGSGLTSPTDLHIRAADGWRWEVSHPSFYLFNRWLTALLGTGCVLLVFLATSQLADRRAGLLAAALLATSTYHVYHSAVITADVPASFFALAALWLAVLYLSSLRPVHLLASLAAVGLAMSTKYNMAVAWVAPTAAFLTVAWRRPEVVRQRLWLTCALLLLPPIAFLLFTPYALLDLPTFLDHSGAEIRHYLVAGHGSMSIEPGWPHLLSDLEGLATSAGPLAAPLALVGMLVLATSRRGVVFLLFPLLQLWLTSRTSIDFDRNLTLVHAAVAVSFGTGAGWLFDRLQRRFAPAGRRRRIAVVAAVLLALAFTVYRAEAVLSWVAASTRPDSRSVLVDRINEALPSPLPPRRILGIAAELRLHPQDLARLEVPYTVRPLVELACRPGREWRVAVPVALSSRTAGRAQLTADRNALLGLGGRVVIRVRADRPVGLEGPLASPAIRVRRRWRRSPELAELCARLEERSTPTENTPPPDG